MFIVAVLMIAKKWKQPKGPPMDEQVKKMWYVHTPYIHTNIIQP